MAKLVTVETQKGGGGGFGAPDVSDDFAKMTNYEKAILRKDIFEMLAQLKVIPYDGKGKPVGKDYIFLTLERSDIEDLNAKSMGAAGHAINSEFAALEVSFRAIPFASKDAEKVKKVVKRGKDIGKEKTAKETDCLKIYRTGNEFDAGLYAVCGEGDMYDKFNQRKNEDGEILCYETFTVGQKLRADRWLSEVAAEEIDAKVLEKIGITVE